MKVIIFASLSALALAGMDMDCGIVPASCVDQMQETQTCANDALDSIGFSQIDSCLVDDDEEIDIMSLVGNSAQSKTKACMIEKLAPTLKSCIVGKVSFELLNATEIIDGFEGSLKKMLTLVMKTIKGNRANILNMARPSRPGKYAAISMNGPEKPSKMQHIAVPLKYNDTEEEESEVEILYDDVESGEEDKKVSNLVANLRSRIMTQGDDDSLGNLNKAAFRLQALKERLGRRQRRSIPTLSQITTMLDFLPDSELKACLSDLFDRITEDDFRAVVCRAASCAPTDLAATTCFQETQALTGAACECTNELIASGQMQSAMDACGITDEHETEMADCSSLADRVSSTIGQAQHMIDAQLGELNCQ